MGSQQPLRSHDYRFPLKLYTPVGARGGLHWQNQPQRMYSVPPRAQNVDGVVEKKGRILRLLVERGA